MGCKRCEFRVLASRISLATEGEGGVGMTSEASPTDPLRHVPLLLTGPGRARGACCLHYSGQRRGPFASGQENFVHRVERLLDNELVRLLREGSWDAEPCCETWGAELRRFYWLKAWELTSMKCRLRLRGVVVSKKRELCHVAVQGGCVGFTISNIKQSLIF